MSPFLPPAYTHDSVHKNQIIDDGTWTYTYDDNGNMTGKDEKAGDDSWVYVWDHANQLIQVEEYDGATLVHNVEFKYDPYGNRVEKIVDGAPVGPATLHERYAYDGWNTSKSTPIGNENWDVFADLTDTNTLTTRYVRGDVVDQVFARVEKDGTTLTPFWLLTDHLGSVRDVIDGTGDPEKSVTYDAFGNVLSQSGSGELGRYAWTGRERDVEIDLQYNRARYYDSTIGRWINEDPSRFAAGDGNLYRYVFNRPLSSQDPSGLEEFVRERDDSNPINQVLTLNVAVDIIGFDGKRITPFQLENDKKLTRVKAFLDRINSVFNSQPTNKGFVELKSESFKGAVLPRLNVHIATDKDKVVDHTIRLKDYPALGPTPTDSYRTKRLEKFKLGSSEIVTPAYTIAAEKDVVVFTAIHHPDVAKFVTDFFGLRPETKDPRYSLLGTALEFKGKTVVNELGAFIPLRYYAKWVEHVNVTLKPGGFVATTRAKLDEDPLIRFLFDTFKLSR